MGYGQSKYDQTNSFPKLFEQLTILKRCFPNLKSLTVTFEITVGFNDKLLSSSNHLKSFLKSLMTLIFTKRIDWCDYPKMCVKLFSHEETGSNVLKNMEFVEETVKECRNEMKELKLIRFNGPSMNKLRMIGGMCAYARIEMEANGIWFDFSFHTM